MCVDFSLFLKQDSRDTDSGKSKSQDSAKSKMSEEMELSLLKARYWVDGSCMSNSQLIPDHKDAVRENVDAEDRCVRPGIQPGCAINDITSQVDRYLNSFHDKDSHVGMTPSEFRTPRKHYSQNPLDHSSIYSQAGKSLDQMPRKSLGVEAGCEDSQIRLPHRSDQEVEKSAVTERLPNTLYQTSSPHYDMATQKINYGQLRYSQQTGKYELPPSFGASPVLEMFEKSANDKEVFLPLEADQVSPVLFLIWFNENSLFEKCFWCIL